ncbi:preprotein translocase subunit YajC [Aeoliella mucimassa]|uniref:Sec translocon accessory complex subunit YajC n=1 Tax=Aeoliella mucimassa TaxID=2527972 RepID=A0A518AKK4_9BACT|nr:preprotein translocase subunit YajC [Aeoliella mucimassa]QDU55253.1 preprotein translocase subunit YajC [Aeoliella mucimassa]
MDWFSSIVLLAQEAANAPAAADGNKDAPSLFSSPMILITLLFAAFYVIVLLPQRREQDKRTRMLEAIKETDKVITSGGMFGTVTNIQKDTGRVTLRVDDNNGTKIKVSLASIAQVLGDDKAEGEN